MTGCETIKAEAELRHPISDCTGCISPAPRHTECPEQLNGLPQGRSTGSDQIGLEHHIAEHRQEKDQKAVAEPLGAHPAGRWLAAGAFKVCPQLAEQLSPSSEVVAKEFVPAKDG